MACAAGTPTRLNVPCCTTDVVGGATTGVEGAAGFELPPHPGRPAVKQRASVAPSVLPLFLPHILKTDIAHLPFFGDCLSARRRF
jgi:hypothetical protein